MFRITVDRTFPATHSIVMRGEREVPHEHDWQVRATIEGRRLDHDGLLCDFHVIEEMLDAILSPLRGSDLNRTAPFTETNPTAEHLARHIAEALAAALTDRLPPGVRVRSVRVTEAPGCTATFLLT